PVRLRSRGENCFVAYASAKIDRVSAATSQDSGRSDGAINGWVAKRESNLIVAAASVWGLYLLGPLSLFAPIVLFCSIAFFGIRRAFASIALLTITTPFFFSFLEGAFDYHNGTATLGYVGLPGTESYNLDPIARCERRGGGCIGFGNEWAIDLPYNAA